MSGIWLISYVALWVLVILQAVILVGLLRQLGALQTKLGPEYNLLVPREGLARNTPAPDFRALDVVHGREIGLAEFAGRTALLIFVAPDCRACSALMPELMTFARSHVGHLALALVCQGEPAHCRELAQNYRVSFPVLLDVEQAVSRAFLVRATPFAYRLDAGGIVQRRGIVSGTDGLEELLRDPSRPEVEIELPRSA